MIAKKLYKKKTNMTIRTYYLTFGFRVHISDALLVLGYTEENLTDKIRNMLNEEFGEEERSVDEYLKLWLEYSINYKPYFEINGQKYVIRDYKHDTEYTKYLVIGVEIGKINRFTGEMEKIENVKNGENLREIMQLVKDERWIKCIQTAETTKDNCRSYKLKDYGVPDLERGSIVPSVFTTTDDCDCCS